MLKTIAIIRNFHLHDLCKGFITFHMNGSWLFSNVIYYETFQKYMNMYPLIRLREKQKIEAGAITKNKVETKIETVYKNMLLNQSIM